MKVEVSRSGLVEAEHLVAAAAVDGSGRVVATFGDVDRDFFGRSSFKPFQAFVSRRRGADLSPEQTAVASASHGGQPAHLAIVEGMLAEGGLSETDLRCPPARPASLAADRLAASRGDVDPAPIFHNCSGKHAAMLRACAAEGWSLDYTAPDHPLQREVVAVVEEMTSRTCTPTGVDGCGVPTLRTDVISLARGFAGLAGDAAFTPIVDAMYRFAALVADGDRTDTEIARWIPVVVKGGAAGCVGAVWSEGAMGFAAKAWTGDGAAAAVALVAMMDRVGIVSPHQRANLATVAAPAVVGGGRQVGGAALVD